jgi:hypothetical protein
MQYQQSIDFSDIDPSSQDEFKILSNETFDGNVQRDLARLRGGASSGTREKKRKAFINCTDIVSHSSASFRICRLFGIRSVALFFCFWILLIGRPPSACH